AAFRATLEEIADSDLLLHLVDMSHPRFDAQIKAVEGILHELGDGDIPRLLVFNKADLLDAERRPEILDERPGRLAISAEKRDRLGDLLRAVDDGLLARKRTRVG